MFRGKIVVPGGGDLFRIRSFVDFLFSCDNSVEGQTSLTSTYVIASIYVLHRTFLFFISRSHTYHSLRGLKET